MEGTKNAMVVAWDSKLGMLYMTAESKDSISVADSSFDSELWHRRLNTWARKGWRYCHKKEMLLELKKIDAGFCKVYIYGKNRWVCFLKIVRTLKMEKMELVHNDVWGPFQYNPIEASNILCLLLIPPGKYGYIFWKINRVSLCLVRSGQRRLKSNRHEREKYEDIQWRWVWHPWIQRVFSQQKGSEWSN